MVVVSRSFKLLLCTYCIYLCLHSSDLTISPEDDDLDDLSLSVSLPSGGGGGKGEDSSSCEEEDEERRRLSEVRKGILKILSTDEEEEQGGKVRLLKF